MGKFEQFLHQDFTALQKANNEQGGGGGGGVGGNKRPHPSSSAYHTNKAVKSEPSTPDRPITTTDSPAALGSAATNRSLEASFSQQSAVGGIAYADRTNRGSTMLAYNTSLGDRGEVVPSDQKPLGLRATITSEEDDMENIHQRYRFMYTTLEERARALDKHLLRIQKTMCQRAQLSEESISPVGIPSQEIVWVCGRICCETAQGRLNKSSVWLEGSRKESNGRRVHLILSELPSFSLFPGQVVLVEGICSNGKKMVVKRLLEGCAAPFPKTSPSELLNLHQSSYAQGGNALKIIAAAGPFTSSDDLRYEPLQDLLIQILREKPDVVILFGPFVDANQPLLSTGDIVLENDSDNPEAGSHGASYEMVFVEKVIRDGLQTLFNSESEVGTLSTQFVLIPSIQDAFHEMVFPQPPIGDRDEVRTPYFEEALGLLDIPFSRSHDPLKRVHCFSNPCMFRVNEVLIGTCTNDILFGLSSDEASQAIEGNRLCRLAGHVAHQQSFAPQFPVPPNAYAAQLDLRQAKHWTMSHTPDLLILPSRLSPLAKEVVVNTADLVSSSSTSSQMLVVNPGLLVKGRAGGSYAEITIHPLPETSLREALLKGEQWLPHNVTTRTSVRIVKI
eukprot:scaffold46_cov196-Ochromonas_danica.AAC.9